MEDCYNLQDAVEQLIQKGTLAKYIASQKKPLKEKSIPQRDEERRNPRHQRTLEPERT